MPLTRDDVEVGAMFGALAGVAALVIALGWWVVERVRGTAPAFAPVLVVHLANVLVYALLGVAVSALWPRRRSFPVRLSMWILVAAAGSLTVVTVVSGPFWRWPPLTWGKYALMAVAFGVVSVGPRRVQRRSG